MERKEFAETLKETMIGIPGNRWTEYGNSINEMSINFLNIATIFEDYVPTELTENIFELMAASHAFHRCTIAMPHIYENMYGNGTMNQVFMEHAINQLHLAFKSISKLSNYFMNELISGQTRARGGPPEASS